MTTPVRLQLVVPFQQSIAADVEALDRACDDCYAPLLDAIGARPSLRVALHFSGSLLDHLAKSRESLLLRVRQLVKDGQVEVLGGPFYNGVPALLPELDISGQLQMSGEFWESYLGAAPRGFWLSDLAWCSELPRLFEDTGLEYGFIGRSQLNLPPSGERGLVTLERADKRLLGFVLDEALSAALPKRPADEWVAALVDHAGTAGGERLVSVVVRAEALGLDPGSHDWCYRDGWLGQWLDALTSRDDVQTVLPSAAIEGAVSVRAGLRDVLGKELVSQLDAPADLRWDDLARNVPEVGSLFRRMLKVSSKLRDAISSMEDEGLEETWSDTLATAQRMVFAAQASEIFLPRQRAGLSYATVRDAAYARLSEAEQMIDRLVQGEDDWIAMEEEDLDGDASDEVFVTTAHLGVWADPKQGGTVRAVDWRAFGSNLLDVGGRGRSGVRLLLLEQRTSAAEYFAGSATELLPEVLPWQVGRSEIDDQGDYAYHAEITGAATLAGVRPRQVEIQRRLSIPIDAPAFEAHAQVRLSGEPEVVVGFELPLRLGDGPVVVTVDGRLLPAGSREVQDIRSAVLESAEGLVVRLTSEKPFDLWMQRVAQPGGSDADEGWVLVPNVPVASEGGLALRIELAASAGVEGEEENVAPEVEAAPRAAGPDATIPDIESPPPGEITSR